MILYTCGQKTHGPAFAHPCAKAGKALEAELILFCRKHLSPIKCPKSIDFEAELPRTPTGKLVKRHLRDKYWPKSKVRVYSGNPRNIFRKTENHGNVSFSKNSKRIFQIVSPGKILTGGAGKRGIKI